MVKIPDLFLLEANKFKDESDVTSRPMDSGKPSKKYSGNSYISGFAPSASNDCVSVSAEGFIDVNMIFDARSCIIETVTRLSGFSFDDWKTNELDLSLLIVLRSVFTPTVIISFEL